MLLVDFHNNFLTDCSFEFINQGINKKLNRISADIGFAFIDLGEQTSSIEIQVQERSCQKNLQTNLIDLRLF